MAQDVRDSISNRPELILEAVKAIGRSATKRSVFEAVYYHKKMLKTVTEVMERTGLNRMQALQAGIQLVRSGIVEQEKSGGEVAYRQIGFFQHHKARILDLLDHPEKIKTFATKRNPAVSFETGHAPIISRKRMTGRAARASGGRLRIAFLSTNPDPTSQLRTDIEARAVLRALQAAGLRDQVDIRLFPAATANDLVNALNDFSPQIVHFGGHGGDERVLFDDETLEGRGGIDVDFTLINKILGATDNKPRLVVFNACETLDGAEQFLDNVEAVVAMSGEIGDSAAALFAGQFYRALASRQSLRAAIEQGKNAIEIAQLGDFDLPTPVVRPRIDLGSLVLLR